MQLLAFTEAPNHVCFRYRLQAFAPALAQHGIQLVEMPLAHGTVERLLQLRCARQADVVVLQRKLLPIWQLALLRRWSRVLIYDYDDAMFIRDSFARKAHQSRTRASAFRATVRVSDRVLAGHGWLADHARKYSERVQVAPTCIDTDRYAPATHTRAGAEARLVWIGQRSTLPYLERAKPCLSAIAERVPGLKLKIICDRFPENAGIGIEPCTWSGPTEARELASADIGLSWLTDDDWSRGKCGLKVLQYMAAGLPVVGNPVGVTSEMIIDGETGFLVRSPEEWADRVALLANDPELRQRMGHCARQFVIERYSVQSWSGRMGRIVASAAQHGAVKAPRLRMAQVAAGRSLVQRLLSLLACLPLLVTAVGCVRVQDLPPMLPVEPTVVRDQLVMSSTFPLPHNHRLVEELVAQRYDLANKLELPTSDEPIHVYLFDNADKFNTFLAERFPRFPKRRAFFVETDTQLTVYAHWGDRVGEDLRHEIAHGYLHSVVPNLPLWLDEGLAEYFEVPRGSGGFNPPHVAELTQRVASGWQPDLVRLEMLNNAATMTQADYAESWAWMHFCLEGNPEAGKVLKSYLKTLRQTGKAEPLSAQLYRQLPKVRQLWLAHLEQLNQLNQLAQQPVEG